MITRIDVLKSLVNFDRPFTEIKSELKNLGWDYVGDGVVLLADQVVSILDRYLKGKIDESELEEWANLIEGREDIEFEKTKEGKISSVIHALANP